MVKEKIVKTVEQFACMTSSEIVRTVSSDRNYWIVGNVSGKDRRIIVKSN